MPTPAHVLPISNEVLKQLLIDNGVVDEAVLNNALQEVTDQHSFYDELLDKDLISDANLGKLIAEALELPFIVLSSISIPVEVLQIIPVELARTRQAICFREEEQSMSVATCQPHANDFLQLLAKKIGKEIKLYFATPRDIEKQLSEYRPNLDQTLTELLGTSVVDGKLQLSKLPTAQMVETVIQGAYDEQASDIHLEQWADYSLVRYRIDGVLRDILKLPRELHPQLINRLKVLARLRTDEHLSAQDGRIQVKLQEEDLDIRLSIVPHIKGEKAVLRLLSSHSRQFALADLGMNDQSLTRIKEAMSRPYGMIISTGPTGSGKTTSMYAILKILNVREKNIATIEDPVEYQIEGINQIQVNAKTNLTFAQGLRSILRQDPDIVYVGEIRDSETADIAINAATTGHLVLSTLHTNDAATTLPRLSDMNIEPFLIASTVNVIVGQRLVRKICDKCKVSVIASLNSFTLPIAKEVIKKYFPNESEISFYKGKGCSVCHNSGYRGRVGIFEVLVVSDEIRKLIVKQSDSGVIMKQAVEEGMQTMFEDGVQKVQQGLTTFEEVLSSVKY
jgi:type IV pilus assembly protein PilB